MNQAIAQLKGFAQYSYFFDHLKSPAWLEPLSKRHFFEKPPEPKREGDYVQMRIWPESRYLVRMAQNPEAQATVLNITLRIPDSENSRVHDDVADIALSLPAPIAAQLVPQISRYIEFPVKLLLAEKIGDLIVQLSQGRQREAAIALARAALTLAPEPPQGDSESDKIFHIPDPRARFRDWDYARIVQKSAPALADSFGLDAVRLFSDLLDDAARFSNKEPGAAEEDYFYIRYPTIDNSPGRHDYASWLLWALREAAIRAIAGNPREMEPALQVLGQHKWSSFRRLELYLTLLFPEQRAVHAERLLAKPEILESDSLRHEAIPLLKESFSGLSAERQLQILAWMDAGPAEELVRRFLEQFSDQPVTTELIGHVIKVRRRNRLSIIADQLPEPEPYRQHYEQLKAELGEVPPERPPIRGFYQVGAHSPKSPAELDAMSVGEILELLASWVPGTDILEPTAEGLGTALASAVSRRAVDFVAEGGKFKTLDPTYLRSLFAGLTTALRNGEKLDWVPILEPAGWVTQQPRTIEGRKGGRLIADPDWGWTRDSIIDLLKTGFAGGAALLPCDLRSRVWNVLVPLTDDPFPSVESEKGEKFDPAFLSINSTRGRAIETVLDYASWVRNCLKNEGAGVEGAPATLSKMPEVHEVLDRHLDLKREPTLTIHSIYGQMLSSLALLDWDWLLANILRIFPLDQEQSRYFSAAWETFVVFNQPSGQLLKQMIPVYRKAVAEIPRGPQMVRSPQSSVESLAQHLMIYYWWGLINLGGEDGLLDRFYEVAPDKLRGQAMWFIGRNVAGFGVDAPANVFERLSNLMEWRLALAEGSATPELFAKELAGFGWWFASRKFDDRWSIDTLLRTLRLTKNTEDKMDVVKRLAELSATFPAEGVECLRLMVEGDHEGWLLIGVEVGVRTIIETALRSTRPEAGNAALRLAEELIARGHYEFRTLRS